MPDGLFVCVKFTFLMSFKHSVYLSFLFNVVCVFQFDINRNTKYDRMRISKKMK